MNTDLQQVLTEWAENVIGKIQSNLDSTGTTASGKTKESLRYEVNDNQLIIYGRQYFRSVEEGRGAGNIPYKFNDILYKWAEAKGILANFGETESQQRSAMYAVGQFIKKNGTQLYIKGGRTDIYSNVLNDEVPVLMDQIGWMVMDTIVKDLKENNKFNKK